MSTKTNRRSFLKTSAAAGVGFWVAGGLSVRASESPNEQIGMASIGIGGKGSSDSGDAGANGRMVAICDVDTQRLQGAARRFPGAKVYTDFRKMLEEMDKSIDAVTVSTPDHTHAPAALMAMRMGKHCFCQKPLTHSIYEARLMARVAREKKVATQMGNQGTASDSLRRAAALIRAGAIGTVKEVHVWTNRPIWPQGIPRPEPSPCPETLKWDLWLGPAPERPYAKGYHPFAWRGWWDFGTGALGDMACHEMNMPYMALELDNPISVQAETSGHNRDSYPKWSIITYEFGPKDWRPGLKLVWYDGGKLPPDELFEGQKRQGPTVVVGEKGKMIGYGRLVGGTEKEVSFPKSPGHFAEWVRAIRGGEPAMSNFPNYAGPLTEMVLLGNLAVWVANEPGVGPKLEWDHKAMKCTNIPGLERLIKPEYRKGYVLDA